MNKTPSPAALKKIQTSSEYGLVSQNSKESVPLKKEEESVPSKPEREFDARKLYDIYQCTIAMRDKICGGTPRNEDVLRSAIIARTGHEDDVTREQITEAIANSPKGSAASEIDEMVEEKIEKSWNGFPKDGAKGIFIWCRQVKALFKESATMLRVTVDKRGSKQIFQHGFEIKGPDVADKLYLGKQEPDGFDEGPIHVQTAQGPRTALKRVDFVSQPKLQFEIWVLTTHAADKRHIGENDIRLLLTFAQENGLGADRSQGRGKFDVIEFARLKA